MVNQFSQKSCMKMAEIENDSTALTVISPLYWNAIDYDFHDQNYEERYRVRKY